METVNTGMENSWAIVVPGSGGVEQDGSYRIGLRAVRCLRTATRLAEQRRPRAVVFSGWSPLGGPTEAEQMRAAWEGPEDIDLVVEPSATITAENMSRSLPLLRERGVREVTIVCGWLHLPRVRYHFGGVYPRHGIACSYALARQPPTPADLAWEATALLLMRRQRRAAAAEIRAAQSST
ncbi:MAG: YdcF family protein, partial [Gaiellales bacterium]